MGNMTLCIAAAPLSWNGREFEAKAKAYLSLGEVSLEKEFKNKTEEKDGLIV